MEAVLAALAADGAVIVRDFLSRRRCTTFRDDMEAHAAGHPAGTRRRERDGAAVLGAHTKRFTRLAHRSAAFVDILTDPFYLAVADEVLLPHAQRLLDEHRPDDDHRSGGEGAVAAP